jgi:hypothetical protein
MDPEQLVGDTIYNGPLGLATSFADLAFKGAAGKSVGDTVLAMVTGDDSIGNNVQVAANAPKPTPQLQPTAPLQPAAPAQSVMAAPSPLVAPAAVASTQTYDLDALQAAIKRNGINANLGLRATLTYQQSMGVSGGVVPKPTN